MLSKNSISTAQKIALVMTGTILLSWVAVWNGYPLVTGDTGSYIRHAFDFQVPADRSPFYGIFIGFSSLHISLWFTVIAQSLLLSYVLYRYTLLLTGSALPFFIYGIGIILAIGVSCAAWLTGAIMPDVFTPILLLSAILYIYDTHASKAKRVAYLFIISGSIIVHNSHYYIFLIFSCLLLGLSFIIKQLGHLKKPAFTFFTIVTASILFICSINLVKGFGFTVSAGSHVFIVSKLSETGILKKYLNDSCHSKKLALCNFEKDLPLSAIDYMWADYSPLYKTGGWDSSKREYNIIIKDVFTEPEYLEMFASASVIHSAMQFTEVQISPEYPPLGEGTSPFQYIKQFFPGELPQYEHSIQSQGELKPTGWRMLYLVSLLVSCITAIVAIKKFKRPEILQIYLLILIFLCCNAFITATFSTVCDRFQYRVSWLVPATNLLVSLAALHAKRMLKY